MDHKDLVFEDVRLLRGGVNVSGVLRLGKYLARFTYDADENAPANGGERHSESSTSARVSSDPKAAGQKKASKADSRTRDYWIPYPLINYCVLTPSSSQTTRVAGHNVHTENASAADGDFPPVYGTNAYSRSSTDSSHLAPYSSPNRSASPAATNPGSSFTVAGGREPRIRIRRRDFQKLALLFYPTIEKSSEEHAREVFYALRSRCCVDRVKDMHAFAFKAPQEELDIDTVAYDARREFARMGISGKAAEGPGSAWRITDINHDYSFSPTYPSVLCVPRTVSDNLLKYGGPYRSKCRIPALTYLHSNGGSITRSSQPMPGIQGKRNPQDERLVSAIFASHTPSQQSPADSPSLVPTLDPSTATQPEPNSSNINSEIMGLSLSQSDTALGDSTEANAVPQRKVYGSTRRNVIIDARPKLNAIANRAGGGGFEDVAHYGGAAGIPPQRLFLNIANIHVMRKSLEKVIEGLGSTDLFKLQPDSDVLRKSGWLGHISGLLEGSTEVVKVVGLGGGHVLVHCSDGWDRTSQVAAIAEVMLDPFYRTLDGFITLVQKDFLSFGHKFNERMGILGCEKWFEIENERVAPSKPRDNSSEDSNALNAFGSKAFTGAKNWLEKNRGSLFRQQNDTRNSLDGPGSRPPSPPPNPLLHAPATSNVVKDREHKIKEDEIAPIFHQFLDAIFQLQDQFPNAFEFNERFLRRLFYQANVAQYGEFLFDNEKQRAQEETSFASVWPHFLSRRREFTNPDYVAKVDDPLLLPRRSPTNEIEVRWWSALFGQELNTARSLAPPDPEPAPNPPNLSNQSSTLTMDHGHAVSDTTDFSTVNEARSVPDLGEVRDEMASVHMTAQDSNAAVRPSIEQRETDERVLASYVTPSRQEQETPSNAPATVEIEVQDGDPLGVSRGQKVQEVQAGRLDFAAFARGSAYSER